MPARKPVQRKHTDTFSADRGWGYLIDDGQVAFGSALRWTPAEARRAWPQYRRWSWLRTPRLMAPAAARMYDGVELIAHWAVPLAAESLWKVEHLAGAQADIAEALASDRAAMRRHQRSAAGRELRDVLEVLARDLDALEQALPGLWALAGDKDYKFRGWFYQRRFEPAGCHRYGEVIGAVGVDEE